VRSRCWVWKSARNDQTRPYNIRKLLAVHRRIVRRAFHHPVRTSAIYLSETDPRMEQLWSNPRETKPLFQDIAVFVI
jgi:hypothetical protein